MNRNTLITITLVLVALAWLSLENPKPKSQRETLVLKNLKPDAVDAIRLKQGEEVLHFVRQKDGDWELVTMAGFQADRDRIAELMLKISTLRFGDKVSTGEGFYSQYELGKGQGFEIELLQGQQVAGSIILGKERMREGGMFGSMPDGQYMRLSSGSDIYLLKDGLNLSTDKMTWISKRLPVVSAAEVAELSAGVGDKAVTASRASTSDMFSVSSVSGNEQLNTRALEAWQKSMENLSFSGLKPVTSEEVSALMTATQIFSVKTFSGLVLRMHISEGKTESGNHFARLEADSMGNEAAVREQAQALMRRYDGWAVELPSWTVTTLLKSRTDLITMPEVGARHILISFEGSSASDGAKRTKEEALALAKELIAKLNAGEDFAALAKEHSADASNRDSGGDLGTFGPGRMVKPFEEATYALAPGARVSEPVETEFGFHIIERTR